MQIMTNSEREARNQAMFAEYMEGQKYTGKVQSAKYGVSIDQYYGIIDRMRKVQRRKPRK